MRRLSLLPLGLLFWCWCASARAATYPLCTEVGTPSGGDAAHQKYIAGKLDYDEANYESAIRRFRDAYALDCTKHDLLIIISAAYERKGDKAEAVAALETYLERAPSSPDASTYRAKIENLKKQIAAQPPASPPPPPPVEVREHSPYPWVVVGAGVVAVGVGVAVVVTAPALPSNCDADTRICVPRPNEAPAELQAQQDQAGRAQEQPVWGAVTIGAGGLLVAGGLLWHFLEPTGPKAAAALRPAVGPRFAGLAFAGAF